ncbi:TolC family outer membrane protein [Caulobacter hibisci]|uniref:TolC family outer membrane protein n=1 Tax=Caulobacter hibisci TaxID=2035993 RepID=A0ABS0SUB8_9CAUL|nr:TolC family outer membrane protein [Caulobacter hibisci]MBI1683237.1 TolC family outer membrane protein [Caulobacter hibisci]
MSKSRRAGLLAAACCMSFLASAANAETLTDAVALAYQTNPTLQQQRAALRATDEGVVQAKSAFRPTVSGSADLTASRTDYGTDASPSRPYDTLKTSGSGASVSLSQPLYTGGKASANLTAAQANVLAGREDLRSVEQSLLANVITAYVDVRRTQESLRIAQENVNVLTRQLDESNARFEVGEITRTDVAQSQARLAAAKASLSSSQASLAVARANYAQIVGQNPTDLAPEPSLAALLPGTVEQAFDAAEANNPTVVAARYDEQAATAAVAAARAAYLPTVAAGASFGYDASEVNAAGKSGKQFGDYDRAIAGSITARVPIFAGGLNASTIRAARERENAARIAVEGAKRTVVQQVSSAWSNLLAARANLVSNEEQVRATKIAFEGVRQEQQVGLRTTLDVLNAQQELRAAELALVTARRDEYVASAGVLQAMGALDVGKLAPDVTRYDPKTSFDKVNHAIGWVPWEPVVQALDKVASPAAVVPAAGK